MEFYAGEKYIRDSYLALGEPEHNWINLGMKKTPRGREWFLAGGKTSHELLELLPRYGKEWTELVASINMMDAKAYWGYEMARGHMVCALLAAQVAVGEPLPKN